MLGYEQFVLDQPLNHFDITAVSTGWTLLITTPNANGRRRAVNISNNDAALVLAVRIVSHGAAAPDNTAVTTAMASFNIAPQQAKLWPASSAQDIYVRSLSSTIACTGEEYA